MRFKDKVVILTGGSSGIGKAAAVLFAKEGASVAIADLSEKMGEELVEEIEAAGGKALFIKTEVSRLDEVERMLEQTISRFGFVHVLVNSAGILGPCIRTDKYLEEDFDKVIDVNIKGLWNCMKVVLQYFVAQHNGNIVNIASVAGHLGMAGHIAYAASKHAVLGMTKTAGIEYAKHGIRINAVCPGFIQTPMLESTEITHAEALRYSIPMKRFGRPEEIATAILYLAGEESSFMTGQHIVLDGGLILQ